jgi:hypothetical protein
MKKISIRFGVAVLAFVLGVAAAFFYRAKPDVAAPPVPKLEAAQTESRACFPGKSIEIQVLGKLRFFPRVQSSHDERFNDFREKWYSEHLKAMKEESMYGGDDKAVESYRFLWLRSFNHPVVVRIWKTETAQFISLKEASGAGGYEPGHLIIDRTRQLDAAEWNAFVQRLDDSCYWNLPTEDPKESGLDGAQWVLEGVKEGRYHMVDRWTPTAGTFHDACLYALQLSGLKLGGDERVY